MQTGPHGGADVIFANLARGEAATLTRRLWRFTLREFSPALLSARFQGGRGVRWSRERAVWGALCGDRVRLPSG